MRPFETEHLSPPPPSVARRRPIVVAIAGGSATGKTTLARALAAALEELRPVVLMQDRYFRDFAEYSIEEREKVRTANHPNALHWEAFHAALDALCAGRAITEPAKGTRPHERGEPSRAIGPAGLVLIEGLFALWDERCRTLADLRLYTDVDDDERVLRRVERDVAERGTDLEHTIAWYRRDVMPNYAIYTASTRRYADLVVPTNRINDGATRALADAISALHRRIANSPSCFGQ